jgi:hypothetical protein
MGMHFHTRYSSRGRWSGGLSHRAQPQETKGIALSWTIKSTLASVYKRSFIDVT